MTLQPAPAAVGSPALHLLPLLATYLFVLVGCSGVVLACSASPQHQEATGVVQVAAGHGVARKEQQNIPVELIGDTRRRSSDGRRRRSSPMATPRAADGAVPRDRLVARPRESGRGAKPPVPKAISDLRDAIVRGLGFQSEDLKVTGFDVRDALVGQAVAYEFDMEVGKKAVPVRLLEDVNRWDFVDLPIFRSQADADDDTALAEIGRGARGTFEPTLPPFQLAGPTELWIQDGDDVRLALPFAVMIMTLQFTVLPLLTRQYVEVFCQL